MQPLISGSYICEVEIDGKQEIYWERNWNTAKGNHNEVMPGTIEIAENYQKRFPKRGINYIGAGLLWLITVLEDCGIIIEKTDRYF